MKSSRTKSISIISTYVLMLLSVYILKTEPLSIFISFLAEFAVLFFSFWYLITFTEQKKNWKVSGAAVLFAGGVMIVLQFFFIRIIGHELAWNQFMILRTGTSVVENEQALSDSSTLLQPEFFITVAVIILIYGLRLLSMKSAEQRSTYMHENLFIQALAMTGMVVLGFLLVVSIEATSPMPVISIMVLARIGIEIGMTRWIAKKV